MKARADLLILLVLVLPICAVAAMASDIRGTVFDSKGDALKNATVTLRLKDSDATRTQTTNNSGEFVFAGVASGEYIVSAEAAGFARVEQTVLVVTGSAPEVRFQLQVGLNESVDVKAQPGALGAETATQTTLITKEQVRTTTGATRTNSTSAITSYVPGSYTIHNQLHVHGGHQVTWLVDGVPIPSSNGGVDIGTPFNLNDVSSLEAQRGSYSAEFGDRTYGIFGIVPRTGFDSTREAEVSLSYGNFNLTDNFISFGDHSKRLGYYVSAHGMRTDYALAAPTPQILHDQGYAFGGFGNVIFNRDDKNQFRIVGSLQNDRFNVPNDVESEALGVRDITRQRDGFVFFTWMRTIGQRFVVTASPFYHFASGTFEGGPNDRPLIPRHERSYKYAGLHVVASGVTRRHSLKAGFHGFFERDRNFFRVEAPGEGTELNQELRSRSNLQAFFLGDQYRLTEWLSLIGGMRVTRFAASIREHSVDPRIGGTVRLPRLNWTLHGFYGRYYQEPPLSTVSGPLLEFALKNGFSILPLKGERNEEHQFGITVPAEGWWIDVVYYRTGAKNFLDHEALGASSILFPVTIERGRIRGLDVSIDSPALFKRVRLSFIYALMRIEGQGAITGGLTNFTRSPGLFFLDHDQHHTLKGGFSLKLPWKLIMIEENHYGSGFASVGESDEHDSGDNSPARSAPIDSHLPGNFRVDLSLIRNFGKDWTVSVNSWNVFNKSFLLDNSPTLGGVHWGTPRQLWVEVRYRFRY